MSIKERISHLSLEEKVGSLLTFGFNGTIPTPNIYKYITELNCGGLRLTPNIRAFGSYVDPKTGKTVIKIEDQKYFYKKGVHPPSLTAKEYRDVLNSLQQVALNRKSALPLHFACDQEGDGTEANCVFNGVKIFPKPMGIKATNNIENAYKVAKATAQQIRAIGFNFLHSPVLDISVEPRNPEVYTRAYSDQVDEVVAWSREACKGYAEGGVIATGKHFPGRGASAVDAHFEIPHIDVSKQTLMDRELMPYRILIEEDLLPAIMIAHSIYPAIDPKHIATVSKKVLTGLLREEMGYNGIVTTDSMTMGGIAIRYGVPTACAMSLAAGADLVLMKAQNSLAEETYNTILDWVEKGHISEKEIDQKIERILKAKEKYKIPDTSESQKRSEQFLYNQTIKELAENIAVNSLTVIREEENATPLKSDSNALIVEQIYTLANHKDYHPGILFKACSKHNTELAYLETKLHYDAEDENNIRQLVPNFDTIIFTNLYCRGEGTNLALLNEILGTYPDKKFIIVTNTPYAISIPEKAKNVLMSIGNTPECMQATANYIFGKGPANGSMPISNSNI